MSKNKVSQLAPPEPRLELSPQEMARRLNEQLQRETQMCANEVEAVLKKWHCQMHVIRVYDNDALIQMQIQYVKLPPQPDAPSNPA